MKIKRKLQLRFVLLALAGLVLLQSAIVGFSVWHNYQDMVAKSDTIIGQLRDNPSASFRYFTVKVHPGKGAIKIDTMQNVSVTPEQAGAYTKTALHAGEDRGFVDGYRYHIYTGDTGMRILFLSRHTSLEMYRSTTQGLIWISVGGIVLMAIILSLLSGVVVDPLVINQQKQKAFITAAGHQLKTPLTVIRTQTQLLQLEIGENQWLDGILAQTDQLTDMTEKLIALAKADEYDNAPVVREVLCSRLVTELTDIYMATATKRGFSVECDITDALTVKGSEEELRQLVAILLDNACKYCPEGGKITISLKKERRGCRLTVSNTAAISEANANQFTQRFFRGENAAGKEGFGLGLAIAEAITQRHKGKLTITTAADLFCVTVMLY